MRLIQRLSHSIVHLYRKLKLNCFNCSIVNVLMILLTGNRWVVGQILTLCSLLQETENDVLNNQWLSRSHGKPILREGKVFLG